MKVKFLNKKQIWQLDIKETHELTILEMAVKERLVDYKKRLERILSNNNYKEDKMLLENVKFLEEDIKQSEQILKSFSFEEMRYVK